MIYPNVSPKTKKTMKKYSILLSAAFCIFALASCQVEIFNEMSVAQTGSIPFELKANIDNPSGITKTTLNTGTWAVNWENTDVIYAVTTDEAWGEAYPVAADETVAEFAYDNEKGTFSTTMAIADGKHTFNFLYTAGQQKSYHRGGSTTFQLAGTQTFDASNPTANLKTYDALAAQVAATTPTAFADVDMSHLFTLMKVTLKNRSGDSMTINKFDIEIPGENLYGIFNVNFASTPTVSYNTNGGNKITVNISNGTVANDADLDVFFVMGPVSGYTGDVTFKVMDSKGNTYTKKNTISGPGVTFAAGTYNTASYSLTDADAEDLSGDYLIGAKPSSVWNLMSSTNSSGYYTHTATTVSTEFASLSYTDFSSDVVVNDYIWRLTKTENGYTIKSLKTNKYLALTVDDNKANVADALDDEDKTTYFTVAVDAGSKVATITSVYLSTRALKYNSSNPRFAFYKSGQSSVYLIPAAYDSRTAVTLSFANASVSKTTSNCNEFTGQTATASPNNSAITDNITYTMTGDDIGEITDATSGDLTLNGTAGTATVTATFAGDEDYAPASASYTITVTAGGESTKYFRKVSSITSGKQYLIVGGTLAKALVPSTGSNKKSSVDVVIDGEDKIDSSDYMSYAVTITKNGDYYDISFVNSETTYYLIYGSSTNLNTTTSSPDRHWIVSTSATDGTALQGSFRFKDTSTAGASTKRALIFRASSYNQFGAYSVANPNGTEYYDLDLYKLDD